MTDRSDVLRIDWMDVAQVADVLALSPWKVRRLARDGELAYYDIGGRMAFRPDDVLAYIDRQRRDGPADSYDA